MKKQIMRYKLMADQSLGRANKSEVLNEELRQVGKHMEHVRSACQSTYKKLSQCMQSHGAGDHDKRMKRLSETALALSMLEASKLLLSESDSNQLLGNSLRVCGEAQLGIAKEKAMYEMFIEEHIISPLQTLVETEIPSVLKHRDRLKKLVLDRDGALQNYNKANKAAQFTPGVNPQQTMAKTDALKEEFDQAVIRMEQCKDQLVTEMFEYLSKEVGHGQRMSDYHAKQLDYHRRCVSLLERIEPDLKEVQDNAVMKAAYGKSLSEHLRLTGREIASPIEACTICLVELGIKEEGLFRIGGGAAKLRKFRALLDGGVLDLAPYDAQDDIHAVAGALKQYLRELPDPLLTHDLHGEWIKSASVQDSDQRLQEIWAVMDKLPSSNKANLRYLIRFSALVAQHHETNKMTASNLAVVLAPNLLWSNMDNISKQMMESNLITNIVESMIVYADWFFPGEIDFAVTPNATSYHLNNNLTISNDSKPLAVGHPGPVSPTSPTPTTNRNHSRNSSVDFESHNTPNTLKSKRMKSKAPPPPQTQPPQPPKAHERTKSSPVVISGPMSVTVTDGIPPSKPPIAAKRMSMKKPLKPPPYPPKEENPAPNNGRLPKPQPRPSHRKNPSETPLPSIMIDTNLLESSEGADDEPHSPPMPSLPPPPLPSGLNVNANTGLCGELQVSRVEAGHSTDDEGGQMTQL